MRPPPNTDFSVISDHVHKLALNSPHKRPLPYHSPEHTTEPRPAWHENRANVVRRALVALDCEETATVYGVRVQRTDTFMKLTYHVNADKHGKGALVRYGLEAAVSRVLEIGAQSE